MVGILPLDPNHHEMLSNTLYHGISVEATAKGLIAYSATMIRNKRGVGAEAVRRPQGGHRASERLCIPALSITVYFN